MLRAWFEHANSGGGIARSRVRVVSLMYKKRNQPITYLHSYSNNQQSPKQPPGGVRKTALVCERVMALTQSKVELNRQFMFQVY